MNLISYIYIYIQEYMYLLRIGCPCIPPTPLPNELEFKGMCLKNFTYHHGRLKQKEERKKNQRRTKQAKSWRSHQQIMNLNKGIYTSISYKLFFLPSLSLHVSSSLTTKLINKLTNLTTNILFSTIILLQYASNHITNTKYNILKHTSDNSKYKGIEYYN